MPSQLSFKTDFLRRWKNLSIGDNSSQGWSQKLGNNITEENIADSAKLVQISFKF